MSSQELFAAFMNGDFKTVRKLLKYNEIDVNCKDI